MTVCADCGAELEWYPPRKRWASKLPNRHNIDAWTFTCRVKRTPDGHLIQADYHHTAGEPQQHFRPPH